MPDDIVLRLDRATAEDLYAALYGAGDPRQCKVSC